MLMLIILWSWCKYVSFFISLAQIICKHMPRFYFAVMTSTYLYAFTLNSLKPHSPKYIYLNYNFFSILCQALLSHTSFISLGLLFDSVSNAYHVMFEICPIQAQCHKMVSLLPVTWHRLHLLTFYSLLLEALTSAQQLVLRLVILKNHVQCGPGQFHTISCVKWSLSQALEKIMYALLPGSKNNVSP